ncbi:hypothetical protein Nepgr_026218 [Nepenthes gracilis]|uniref:Amine oxidase domain-containing protein n=1 Tax=Nepenthes gracilis TaxID=150966 RepID=A0AAD3Y1U4_NEPGR|nr:hypothetical protein Nepgr_026218 [Nepenthes gracilis]
MTVLSSSSASLYFSNPTLPTSTHLHSQRRRLYLSSRGTQTTIDTPSLKPSLRSKPQVIVVGAGLAGLAAATKLNSENIPFLLVEASDSVGGRVRTDVVDSFLLDRGFQIFITAYPEARKLLDYQSLNLQKFYSGARVYFDGEFHNVADPWRHFSDSIGALTNPIGTILDKLLIALTRLRASSLSDEEILSSNEVSTIELLRKTGFSNSIIDRFYRPFFGGIFFDRELETTSRLFDFIFKCLALGDNTLPANGIASIPNQLAAKLPPDSIKLNSKVASIDFGTSNPVTLTLKNGEILSSQNGVILAVEEPEAQKLLAGKSADKPVQKKPARSTVCLYFSTDPSGLPDPDPVLYLNGSGKGIVNNMFCPTNVAPSYGPPGKALVSVSLIGSFNDLSGWFGESKVGSWSHLRTYRVRFAQPNQSPPTGLMKGPRVGPQVYVCGDYQNWATFDGALVSGRRAVEALLEDNRVPARLL